MVKPWQDVRCPPGQGTAQRLRKGGVAGRMGRIDRGKILVPGAGMGMERPGKAQRKRILRAGVGLRLGANVGYLGYSRKRKVLPF